MIHQQRIPTGLETPEHPVGSIRPPEPAPDPHAHPTPDHVGHQGHGRHGLMMIACCIPMIVIVAILVATGALGGGAIVFVVLCTALMALMMFTMPGGHQH